MEINDFIVNLLTQNNNKLDKLTETVITKDEFKSLETKFDNLTNNVITRDQCKTCGKSYNLKLITTISTIISGMIGAIVVIIVKVFKLKL